LALHLDCSRAYIGKLEADGVVQRQGPGIARLFGCLHCAARMSSAASFDLGERPSMAFIRKLPKVLRSPRDAVAVINAQLHLRGKAKLPLSVRLTGRIILTGEGQVELGNGVSFVGTVVPIEIASRKGARSR
jgi:hypothetical protein